jgi:hypothetical protein
MSLHCATLRVALHLGKQAKDVGGGKYAKKANYAY